MWDAAGWAVRAPLGQATRRGEVGGDRLGAARWNGEAGQGRDVMWGAARRGGRARGQGRGAAEKYLLVHLARFLLTSSSFAKGRHSVNLLVDIHGGILF